MVSASTAPPPVLVKRITCGSCGINSPSGQFQVQVRNLHRFHAGELRAEQIRQAEVGPHLAVLVGDAGQVRRDQRAAGVHVIAQHGALRVAQAGAFGTYTSLYFASCSGVIR